MVVRGSSSITVASTRQSAQRVDPRREAARHRPRSQGRPPRPLHGPARPAGRRRRQSRARARAGHSPVLENRTAMAGMIELRPRWYPRRAHSTTTGLVLPRRAPGVSARHRARERAADLQLDRTTSELRERKPRRRIRQRMIIARQPRPRGAGSGRDANVSDGWAAEAATSAAGQDEAPASRGPSASQRAERPRRRATAPRPAASSPWPAIRSGDQREVGQLLSDLGNNRTEWLRVNGGRAAANLANAGGGQNRR